jgi:hypothetical protein
VLLSIEFSSENSIHWEIGCLPYENKKSILFLVLLIQILIILEEWESHEKQENPFGH